MFNIKIMPKIYAEGFYNPNSDNPQTRWSAYVEFQFCVENKDDKMPVTWVVSGHPNYLMRLYTEEYYDTAENAIEALKKVLPADHKFTVEVAKDTKSTTK